MKTLHLICNAHLDPAWLWDWEEGAAAAISTFRSAADLAEEFDYLFCHNEVILYRWTEEYDPALFQRIQKLAREGKWRVMGGWYLQPDCNMPSGESFVRQIMSGRKYFWEKLGQYPTTAVNVDPFGHSAGLPQILRGTGYDSYLICRPTAAESDLPDDFLWEGVDGSTVRVCRVHDHYNSPMGEAADKIRSVLERNRDKGCDIVLWGVGNHGGGPSRKDLSDIAQLMRESNTKIIHSTPEAYMAEPARLGRVKGSMRSMPGCYTSMVSLKQRHRLLESQLYTAEKICSAAAIQTGMAYPHEDLNEAQRDLMTAEFHDILPGSGVKAVEETGLRMLDHGLEIAKRMRMRALLRLTAKEKKAAPGEYPIVVFNPHPYPVKTVVEASFVLANQNWGCEFTDLVVYRGDMPLPTQIIKESSNMNLDWAKKVAFTCTLQPLSLNRFDCKTKMVPQRPVLPKESGDIVLRSDRAAVRINRNTGVLDYYAVDGKILIDGQTLPVLYRDTADPWGMKPEQLHGPFAQPEEAFRLMTTEEAAAYLGTTDNAEPVRITEDGPVLTEVESLLCCRKSAMRINWRFCHGSGDVDVTMHLLLLEKNALVKWHVPTAFSGKQMGQVPFGQEALLQDGREVVAQDWVSSSDGNRMLAVLRKGSYGLDCTERELHLTLVRGVAYAAHPIEERPLLRTDRFIPRMDQGERQFSFRLTGGHAQQLSRELERRSQVFLEEPFCLQVFPDGQEEGKQESLVSLEGDAVTMTAMKACEDGGYILRLFNNTQEEVTCRCRIFGVEALTQMQFRPYEVRTYHLQDSVLEPCRFMEI
ncbi:MAG: glycoside hydrolase family 38 C-terminal domain-containing protein [Faecousia sp.]